MNVKVLCVLAIACMLGLSAFLGLLAIPRHGIVEGSAGRIRPGMSQKEVEAILGGPPGDYGPESVASESVCVVVPEPPNREETWNAGYVAVSVLFDADGKAVQARESRCVVGEESWPDTMRRWLRVKK